MKVISSSNLLSYVLMALLGSGQVYGEALKAVVPTAESSGPVPSKGDCDKDAKTKAEEKLKGDLDLKKKGEVEHAAEAKALQNLGLAKADKAQATGISGVGGTMETCK